FILIPYNIFQNSLKKKLAFLLVNMRRYSIIKKYLKTLHKLSLIGQDIFFKHHKLGILFFPSRYAEIEIERAGYRLIQDCHFSRRTIDAGSKNSPSSCLEIKLFGKNINLSFQKMKLSRLIMFLLFQKIFLCCPYVKLFSNRIFPFQWNVKLFLRQMKLFLYKVKLIYLEMKLFLLTV